MIRHETETMIELNLCNEIVLKRSVRCANKNKSCTGYILHPQTLQYAKRHSTLNELKEEENKRSDKDGAKKNEAAFGFQTSDEKSYKIERQVLNEMTHKLRTENTKKGPNAKRHCESALISVFTSRCSSKCMALNVNVHQKPIITIQVCAMNTQH